MNWQKNRTNCIKWKIFLVIKFFKKKKKKKNFLYSWNFREQPIFQREYSYLNLSIIPRSNRSFFRKLVGVLLKLFKRETSYSFQLRNATTAIIWIPACCICMVWKWLYPLQFCINSSEVQNLCHSYLTKMV